MEKHYVFKSLFEDNITQVSSNGGKVHLCTLKCVCQSAQISRCSYSSVATRRLHVDSGCSSPDLCNPIQYRLACRKLSNPPRCQNVVEKTRCAAVSLFVKIRFHSERSTLLRPTHVTTEGVKPLYRAACVSPHRLHRCQYGAKIKSSICFCPTLYIHGKVYPCTGTEVLCRPYGPKGSRGIAVLYRH